MSHLGQPDLHPVAPHHAPLLNIPILSLGPAIYYGDGRRYTVLATQKSAFTLFQGLPTRDFEDSSGSGGKKGALFW